GRRAPRPIREIRPWPVFHRTARGSESDNAHRRSRRDAGRAWWWSRRGKIGNPLSRGARRACFCRNRPGRRERGEWDSLGQALVSVGEGYDGEQQAVSGKDTAERATAGRRAEQPFEEVAQPERGRPE